MRLCGICIKKTWWNYFNCFWTHQDRRTSSLQINKAGRLLNNLECFYFTKSMMTWRNYKSLFDLKNLYIFVKYQTTHYYIESWMLTWFCQRIYNQLQYFNDRNWYFTNDSMLSFSGKNEYPPMIEKSKNIIHIHTLSLESRFFSFNLL